jgi:hypothetical protein
MSNAVDALTFYSPSRGIVLILGLGMLVWGVWVMLPFASFALEAFDLMLNLAIEEFWAGLFIFAGSTMTFGTITGNIEWIRWGAFLGFLLWTIIAVLGCIATPTATLVVTRSIIALLHGWMYVQVKIHPQLITGEVKITDLREYMEHKHNQIEGGNQ